MRQDVPTLGGTDEPSTKGGFKLDYVVLNQHGALLYYVGPGPRVWEGKGLIRQSASSPSPSQSVIICEGEEG
jgi:hypothetical protein